MSEVNVKVARLLDIQRELELRKALYAEYDKLLLELVAEGFESAEVDNMVLTLKDNFALSNTGWTRSAVRRWDIEVVSRELMVKREKRKAKQEAI